MKEQDFIEAMHSIKIREETKDRLYHKCLSHTSPKLKASKTKKRAMLFASILIVFTVVLFRLPASKPTDMRVQFGGGISLIAYAAPSNDYSHFLFDSIKEILDGKISLQVSDGSIGMYENGNVINMGKESNIDINEDFFWIPEDATSATLTFQYSEGGTKRMTGSLLLSRSDEGQFDAILIQLVSYPEYKPD